MEIAKSSRVILQVVDKTLSVADRDRTVQTFWDDLSQLDLTPTDQITPLRDRSQGNTLYGLEVRMPRPEYLEIWLQDISDRLTTQGTSIRLTCEIGRLRVQIQTATGEELLGLCPVVDTILPARQVFQARAATYAMREGEISPVERANLDLLCYRLNLDPEAAEQMINRALGPYRDRQAKLDKYREVLDAELDRHAPPLDDTTEIELQRLRESLHLSAADVAPIHEAEITKRQPPENPDPEPPPEPKDKTPQQHVVAQQNHAEQYRQEFASAIAHSPYPNEFDRGRLEQARRIWELDRELIRAIERETVDERYGPIDSALHLDYTRLRHLLWLHQWEAADQETERLLLSALSQDMRPLTDSAILRLHCVDLQTLDQLWSSYSQGKFGFTAQHQVYVQHDRQANEFLAAVEWASGVGLGGVNLLTRRKAYRDLQFNLQAPLGHLPTWRWEANSLEGEYAINEELVNGVFAQLVERCFSHLKQPPKPPTPSAENATEAGQPEP
ncbi:MAG: GUN4 domain-containing protein [Leptolyngbyaceae cyanobacterium]